MTRPLCSVVLATAALSTVFVFARAFAAKGTLADPVPTLTLKNLSDEVRRANPEIMAARYRWQAARARVIQEATPEKPRLDFERMYGPQDGDPISQAEERNVVISQEIPFPTTLVLRRRRANALASAAEAAYRAKEWEVMSQAQKAWSMYYATWNAIHIYTENAGLMRRMARVAESRYASGSAMQSDVLKAQTELSRMLNMVVTMEQEKEAAQAMLNSLMDRPPQAPLAPPEEPATPAITQKVEELQAVALVQRPDLLESRAILQQAGTSLALARSAYLPDFMVGYRRRDLRNGPGSHDAVLGLTLPLWFWKQNAMVREMDAERAMAEADFSSRKNRALYDVKNLLVRVQTMQRLIELQRTSVLPQAQQTLKVAQAGYQGGRAGFLDLLDAVRTLLTFRLEHHQHIADYVEMRANLERVTGTPLARTGPSIARSEEIARQEAQ